MSSYEVLHTVKVCKLMFKALEMNGKPSKVRQSKKNEPRLNFLSFLDSIKNKTNVVPMFHN